MKVLIDTSVVSELQRTGGSAAVRSRVQAMRSEDLFLSVATLGELAGGVAGLPDGKKRKALDAWLLTLEQNYAGRILPIDADTARIWGEITAAARACGRALGAADGIIAATGLRHGLHVMTRNLDDFRDTGVLVINSGENG